jgi:hypothetical protein
MSSYDTVHISRQTNRNNVQDEWNSHNPPAAIADDPTAPDLHQPVRYHQKDHYK